LTPFFFFIYFNNVIPHPLLILTPLIMEANQYLPKKIIEKILLQKKNYNEALKNDKEFSKVKKIRLKINKLVKELKALSKDKNMNELLLSEVSNYP
jgi:DNA gyrase/topoisomerase IV subunit B